MSSPDTARATPAAWVTCFDDIRCFEASTASKAAWLKSLYLGCLNKSVGDKLSIYSHLRSLSSKEVPIQIEEVRGRRYTIHVDNSEVEIDDQAREQKEVEDSKQRALSLVILEDNSRPPEATEEVEPLLFTSLAFFNYLYSDYWGGHISIRVINGEVLNLLLAALCSLESQFLVDSNIVYANLNNRLPEDGQKQNTAEKGTNKLQEHFPKPYEPSSEFVYEKMNVEIVFYEKAEVSNAPFVIQDIINSENVTNVSMQRGVSCFPYALQQHEIDYVRLPACEDVDNKGTILRLEAELKELKTAELPPKDIPNVARAAEKESAMSEKVEWIADDPYLESENRMKPTLGAIVQSSRSEKDSSSILKTSPPLKLSKVVSEFEPSRILTEEEIILKEILSHISKNYSSHDLESGEEEHTGVQSVKSSEGSYTIISSPIEFMKQYKEVKTYKKLNLTRNELYIAGLYSPRKENAVCLAERLQRTKRIRAASRLGKETDIYKKMQDNLPFDLADRFKCLAATKLNANKKFLEPHSTKKANISRLSYPASLSLWEEYSKDQENMEMDSALINDVERDVLNHILENKKLKMEAEPEVKSKGMKNKTKNNPNEVEGSQTRLKRGKLRSTNQQISTNYNANSLSSNQCEPSTKYKLPSLENNKKKISSRMIKHNSEFPVTLPPLFPNERQYKRGRSRTGKNSCIGNKERIHDLVTDELGNPTTERDTKNKKQRNKHRLQSESFCEDILVKNDMVLNSSKQCAMLSSPQSMNNSNRNRNQNSLSGNELAELDEPEENPAVDEEVNDESHETLSAPESDQSIDKEENEVKYVDSYDEKLEQYRCDCLCEECICLTETLSRETEDTQVSTYPMLLGRMRRDFKFLKSANYEPKGFSTRADPYFKNPKLTHQFACDNLLKLMEDVMIRKEILTSSLGYRYTTVTFTKPVATNINISDVLTEAKTGRQLITNIRRRQSSFLKNIMKRRKTKYVVTIGKICGEGDRGRFLTAFCRIVDRKGVGA